MDDQDDELDTVLTAALLDRLTHKAHLVNMNGKSFRMKETRKMQQAKKWCSDNRGYSWQVAPLQSLFPLPSGETKLTEMVKKRRIPWKNKINQKRKKEPKKEISGMGFAHKIF